ncbi:LexA family transcriptional regulator [Terribacillus saccharophilus]|uniref:LexA family transcriptional regulator n=1 Tax=Terribacillus saccharophilus TaxID=361277 RepID=UPI001594EE4B|nr:helix-turn-helix transcriptional regulator [Terribacillus saccharophilus]
MSYSELLKKNIVKSGLSLSQISERLKERGFSTDKGYISKLQNGKIPPARDDLNRALADILQIHEDELITAAYIDKAPNNKIRVLMELRNIEKNTFEMTFRPLINGILNLPQVYNLMREKYSELLEGDALNAFLKKTQTPEDLVDVLKEQQMYYRNKIVHADLGNEESMDQAFEDYMNFHETLTDISKIVSEELSNSYIENEINKKYSLVSVKEDFSVEYAPEKIKEQKLIEIPNKNPKKNYYITHATSNTYVGSRIHEGDELLIEVTKELNSGDMGFVEIDGEYWTGIVSNLDKYSATIFFNLKKFYRLDEVRIIGKVLKVTFTP